MSRTPHVRDLQATNQPLKEPTDQGHPVSIDHVPVQDDPRRWSYARKMITLWIVSAATMISTMSTNIQTSSDALIGAELRATRGQTSLTLAVYIIVQGNCPLLWSVASELKGRKPIYVIASVIFIIGSVAAAYASSIDVFLGMRVFQATGSSAVLAISAATLADIYEPHERGKMMGVFYAAPLLGPATAPILGGTLSQVFGWRANFYFLASCGGIILLATIFLFKDSFRVERSLTYQAALNRRSHSSPKAANTSSESSTAAQCGRSDEEQAPKEKGISLSELQQPTHDASGTKGASTSDVRLSLADVNPFPPVWEIIHRKNNLAILLANGVFFAFTYFLSYTTERVLTLYYHYGPLKIGFVLLALGTGSIFGSVIGGRWSDHVMQKLKEQNAGMWHPEMRLHSTKVAMIWLPACVIGYGWAADRHQNIALNCTLLFFSGFFAIWMYASTLAYLVDANAGRSCSAVAVNASFRGTLAFVATELALPLQRVLGIGGMYTAFAGVLILVELLILLVMYEGALWREAREESSA